MSVEAYSGRTLAFLGDAVWSLAVRRYLLAQGQGKGKQLQKLSISYVSAKAQARFYEQLHERHFFTEWEEEIFRRGRNANGGSVPKNTDVQIYRISTGFEAILGALDIEGKPERVEQILQAAIEIQE